MKYVVLFLKLLHCKYANVVDQNYELINHGKQYNCFKFYNIFTTLVKYTGKNYVGIMPHTGCCKKHV